MGQQGTFCCDPIAWFEASIIGNPSVFVLSLPNLGKSTMVRRMVLFRAGCGDMPIVMGDLKPDYVRLIRALGGQVIEAGRGRGTLNILDPGDALAVAAQLPRKARDQLLADVQARQLTMLEGLITINRRSEPSETESSLLERALQLLADRLDRVPILPDVNEVIESAPEELRTITLDRNDLDEYRRATAPLQRSLHSLTTGKLGSMFSGHTTEPMDMNRPVVFDMSSIGEQDHALRAAALMACWSTGFGAINAAHALADAGLAPERHYFIVLDEMWRVLRAGSGMVDRIDQLTRLNRNEGVGQAMITHTMADLDSLPNEEDRAKARGLIERSGMVITGAQTRREVERLREIMDISEREGSTITSWSTPATWSTNSAGPGENPGLGKFMAKVGNRPGIPFQTRLTSVELDVNNTNLRWSADRRPDAFRTAQQQQEAGS